MKPTLFVPLAFVFLVMNNISLSQTGYEPGDKIDLMLSVELKKVDSVFIYDYRLTNRPSATQELYYFAILPSGLNTISQICAPKNWHAILFKDEPQMIKWLADVKDDEDKYVDPLKPGSSLQSFQLATFSLPGLISFYAEGDHEIPHFPEGMATDSIPGYTDLTPYGPGIIGKTVGPVMPVGPIVLASFFDTLISYKHQALALKWIDNQGIANSLDQKLDAAKKKLEGGDNSAARNILQAFVNEVEAQKDKHLTSEAYALLKFNAEFLIDRLATGGKEGKK